MTARRIIPCLDVRDGRVVKGVRFENHVDMGDAGELAARYRDDGADELVFYDITASPEGRTLDYGWVRDIRPPAASTTGPTRSRSTRRRWNGRT